MSRPHILVVADGDYLEFFSDDSVALHVARVPGAETMRGERIADACLERMIPPRFRQLYDRSLLRANTSVRPLNAEAALAARSMSRAIKSLNRLQDAIKEPEA